ncbi:hypothetical protein EGW08_009430 [Elysia chlorotica]|uniref:Uncharacterized protein n=1 Tax=Elysia chlorotica TaxID=188477 RepID=A0A3S0ZN08_ELYCH|nr:hypothetical protein EGW08_009430 [Elysia chlorotica]
MASSTTIGLQFVERNGRDKNTKDIDKTVKNKFNWSWLDEKDCNDEFASEYIRKLLEPGFAWCLSCKEKINYGSSGKKAIFGHAKKSEHGKARRALRCTQSLPAAMSATKAMEECTASPKLMVPYGSSQRMEHFFKKVGTGHTIPPPPPQPTPVSISDRSHI